MLKTRGFEIRLPADWPPDSVTVNGLPVKHTQIASKPGWTYQGNTLTTVIPVPARSTAAKVTVEVRRAVGLTARRAEIDGFAGIMARLRGTYDAMNEILYIAAPPDVLVEAMQTGDRLSYHPEHAVDEIAHLKTILPQAQASVVKIASNASAKLEDQIAHETAATYTSPSDGHLSEDTRRLASIKRAVAQVTAATQ
jgi:alpha-glucosidase